LAASAVLAQAQTAPATAAASQPASAQSDWTKEAKNPVSWLSWGADLRIRDEYLENTISLDHDAPLHEQNWIRFRSRLWASLKPVDDLSINARVTAEPREITRPYYKAVHSQPKFVGLDWTEGIIDNLNIKWANAFGQPVTFTIGRQDVMFGDPLNWWLVADGTPLDGSRTCFLDAGRVTVNLTDCKTTLDALYIEQSASNDRWLPIINNQMKPLTDQNERGAIFYLSNKSVGKTQVDAYFMWKDDWNPKTPAGEEGDIYTVGGKVTGNITENLRYSVEGACQFGRKALSGAAAKDIDAFGVNDRLTYLFKDSLNNQVRFCHEYLSGDDPATAGKNEQFDLLWGRWPRWSELYIQSYIKESRLAQNDNLHRFGPGWSITPVKDLTFSADYNAVFADQGKTSGGSFSSTGGDFRGHYLQAILKYKFNDHLSAHLWGEFFWAGDFYAKHDLFEYLRAEVYLTF
jgi:hypothetical protein